MRWGWRRVMWRRLTHPYMGARGPMHVATCLRTRPAEGWWIERARRPEGPWEMMGYGYAVCAMNHGNAARCLQALERRFPDWLYRLNTNTKGPEVAASEPPDTIPF